jgi:hypothetical protein
MRVSLQVRATPMLTISKHGTVGAADAVLRFHSGDVAMRLDAGTGPDHQKTALAGVKLAEVMCQLGQPDAESLFKQHIATLKAELGDSSTQVAEASVAFSAAVASRRAYREAEGIAAAALATLKKVWVERVAHLGRQLQLGRLCPRSH